ncbi:hypothetical protein RSOL_490200 [Rhizoctonia solani AG-3 Rhs1AP]|uniref:Uncharacterized protein n=1 Tax=Rhizoctonia solani AG-3 Rhs1AP TaxID=1086054 RepID=X8JHE9_9AGAM|nr:hypothetical protein RSOL_490200 [Rhizoctonia solani AG-3 Rhs1AP]
MALTARAMEPPTWGEEIVPLLRRRLEDESRALTKRMSQSAQPENPQLPINRTSEQERPSHIPRPSLHSLVSNERRARPRTHSQPKPFDHNMLTPASSRPASPAVINTNTPRPSRIPTRPRAGSRPIHTTEFPPSPDPSPDLWSVSENGIRTQLIPPTPERPPHRRKRDTFVPPPPDDNEETLFDEPAPFTINANSLAGRSSIDEYEHWYRGEGRAGGGRNGGRGEIRIATRTEMLEIASFGHPPSRSNLHAHAMGEFGWRNKAYDDSTIGTRFRWPDENVENVLDEAPLTDLDDVDTDSYHPGSQEARSIEVRSVESYRPHDVRSEDHTLEDARSIELEPEPDGRPEPVTPMRPAPSRIARAVSPPVGPGASTASLASRPARSPTPSKALSTMSKPQSPPPKAQSPPPKAQSPPPKTAQTPKAKSPGRRGTNASVTPKSPSSRAGTSQLSPKSGTPRTPRIGAASPGRNNTSPPPRNRAQSTSTKSNTTKRTNKVSTSESIAGAHSLADAIPQIPPAQAIPDDGNWDDVVLPAVARKMQGGDLSLMGREPREEKEDPTPPAPGTFGYQQREKERKEREQRRDSGTELEEFGAWNGMARKPKTVEKVEEKRKAEERKKAPSPPPFSDYTPIPPVVKPPEPVPAPVLQPMTITEFDLRQNMSDPPKNDSHGAGCCKCVIM